MTEEGDDTRRRLTIEITTDQDDGEDEKRRDEDRYGASLKANRSELSRTRSSLKKSLMPSARLWRIPHLPAVLGLIRF